ncbi:MAG: PAS domain S-box protein [Syntrophaceae bacterium]|nr:PAS domain S-box protein [Syntrophaceae bacterium]
MEQNPSIEALKQRVTELEEKLRGYERKEGHPHFHEVTKRLEKIAEMGDDGIIVFDEDYKIEFANTIASELTGYSKERLMGMDFRLLLSERDVGYLDQMHSEVGADESKRVCTEMEVLTQRGLKWDAEVCITIAKKEKGGVQTYAYLRDITERKRMERELREATKRFEKIAEMGDDGIIVFDENSRIEFANQMASEILGLSKDQILGQEFFSLIGKRDEEFLEEMVMRGEGVGEKVCTEMSLQTPQGRIKAAEVCIAPTRSEEGRIKTYAYIRDITERKKFEKELKESEEKFRNLFERVQHGLFISTKEGRFLDCNQALVEMAGYDDKEEFLKIDIPRDLYVNKEDRRKFQKLIEEQGFVKDLEVEFKKKSGEKVTVLLTAHAQRDEKGAIIGYEGLNIDISDRKRMERELKEANEFLMNLIESSVDGIIAADMKGNIIIFNKGAETLTGYLAEEVIGKIHITQIYPEGIAKEIMKKLRSSEYGGAGKFSPTQLNVVNKKGEEIPIQLSAALIYDGTGKEVASVGIFTDLRPRLKMEKDLQEIQQALLQSEKLAAMGRLTSQIAHELNNPIYGIMNTLDLLKTEIPPESKRRRILELSLSETHRLAEMLRNMLSFSKPEEEVRRPVNVNELLEGILLIVDKQMQEANVKIKTYFDEKIPEVMASTNQMRQVMLNLIKNAKEAMPKGGTLTVGTGRERNKVFIHIRDTGMGIPEDIKDKIFEAFFTTKQKVKGVGLGLSVCYGIIKDHGGEIKVESEEGKGTTFIINLPIENRNQDIK